MLHCWEARPEPAQAPARQHPGAGLPKLCSHCSALQSTGSGNESSTENNWEELQVGTYFLF